MGWITDRRNQTGHGIGGTKRTSMAAMGPLVAIKYRYSYAESMFDKDYVRFECGHNGTASGGAKRGRCRKCRDGAPQDEEPG